MLKQSFFLFFFLLFLPQAFSLSVDLSIEIQKTETTLNYIVSFGENESVSSLAIEMPQNASVENVLGNRGEVPYEEAGDFIILRPDAKENGKTYLVKIISEDTSLQIYEKKAFSMYTSFNSEIDNYSVRIALRDNIGKIESVFPRTYKISSDGKFEWTFSNLNEEVLFVINFDEVYGLEDDSQDKTDTLLVLLLFIPILLFFLFFFFLLRRTPKQTQATQSPQVLPIKKETMPERNEEQVTPLEIQAQEESEKDHEKEEEEKAPIGSPEKTGDDNFEQLIHKYLTENERDVVQVVKKHEGLSQYDILNFLPALTKSNLSKIVTKLHNKKFLNRIKVGKVNKLHLGEKLEEKK
ncbi:hypothetical protein H6501_03885 [Candidatus Woesearchaeota archaeon]|nr:hypothetical protein [Candidatus Woesearchaeota archaeon]